MDGGIMRAKDIDDIEIVLKAYFSKQKNIPARSKDCPPIDVLGKYATGVLESNELHNMQNHARGCNFCSELIEGALFYSVYRRHIKLDAVANKIKNKVKSLHPNYKIEEGKIMNYIKSNLWLILCLSSLTISFFLPYYFLQFLILAAVFGLKWVFNKETTRTLIMIYNAWKRQGKDANREIQQIFEHRL
jgi:hypothetical protein